MYRIVQNRHMTRKERKAYGLAGFLERFVAVVLGVAAGRLAKAARHDLN